jgi:hypothetical protein
LLNGKDLLHAVPSKVARAGTGWDPRQSFRPGVTRTLAAEPQIMALWVPEPGRFNWQKDQKGRGDWQRADLRVTGQLCVTSLGALYPRPQAGPDRHVSAIS